MTTTQRLATSNDQSVVVPVSSIIDPFNFTDKFYRQSHGQTHASITNSEVVIINSRVVTDNEKPIDDDIPGIKPLAGLLFSGMLFGLPTLVGLGDSDGAAEGAWLGDGVGDFVVGEAVGGQVATT